MKKVLVILVMGILAMMYTACSDYRGFLSYLGLTGSEINACMELEG